MLSEEQITLLKKAHYGQLPKEIAEPDDSTLVKVLKTLLDYGFIDADDESSSSGSLYINVQITLTGRQYVSSLMDKNQKATDEIFELKPNISGMGINLRALYRKLFGK